MAVMYLTDSLSAWGKPEFSAVLQRELQRLPIDVLPLQQGVVHGSYVSQPLQSIMLIKSADLGHRVSATIGIFYSSMLGGCSCADDPSPVAPVNEYCEVQLEIDKSTAAATATLLPD